MKSIQYTNIRRVLDELHRHPLLESVTLEQVVSYVISFIGMFGMPKLFKEEEVELHIEDYRCLLPCNCIEVNMVKDKKTGVCLRSMTGTFHDKDVEFTFKTYGQVLFTSFRERDVLVSYKSIPIDEDGYPLLIDNPVFLKTLELYIKKEVFTVLFDMGKIHNQVLQNTQQEYAFKAAQCRSEFSTPSISEMESIKNMWTTLLQSNTKFNDGFKSLGRQEYIKNH